jgi:hypothetical protein
MLCLELSASNAGNSLKVDGEEVANNEVEAVAAAEEL